MIALPEEVSFAKRTVGPGCWIYDFHHVWLGPLGRVVLTELPDAPLTQVSCELAENPDMALTAGRRQVFEPIGREIADRMEQAFAHRLAILDQSGPSFPSSST